VSDLLYTCLRVVFKFIFGLKTLTVLWRFSAIIFLEITWDIILITEQNCNLFCNSKFNLIIQIKTAS